jgi:hypothetical protein
MTISSIGHNNLQNKMMPKNYPNLFKMVNAFNDLDINGRIFYYKGHVVHLYTDVQGPFDLFYFVYNDIKIYMNPQCIGINDNTGNKFYNGRFYYSIEEFYEHYYNGRIFETKQCNNEEIKHKKFENPEH